ncbi:response regulator [Paucibacter sp. Y2R2-4]|uniref:response regulator n=1 Tax=Paucibacter sp. Y2R2-4 TaxID=2893553 RepID=UPI0021E3E1B5|nr:response regulator [Paucibacter sp. Y2R2-4]MCV2351503.1 response regulator [Paucibacter sp. Y2R2-4]
MNPASAPYVIYVEDDRINIVLMEEVFRRLPGWRLECAEDGAQALTLLSEDQPDLVLIDMNLPDMTGLDLLQKLRAEPASAQLRCVALSADDLTEQVEAALQAGFSDYWLKPIDVERLAESLKATLPLVSLELKSTF